VFNGIRFNGAPFNAFPGGALFNSSQREPDFRWLLVRAQPFTVTVAPERGRLLVKSDNV
jgi:hypothetical protein